MPISELRNDTLTIVKYAARVNSAFIKMNTNVVLLLMSCEPTWYAKRGFANITKPYFKFHRQYRRLLNISIRHLYGVESASNGIDQFQYLLSLILSNHTQSVSSVENKKTLSSLPRAFSDLTSRSLDFAGKLRRIIRGNQYCNSRNIIFYTPYAEYTSAVDNMIHFDEFVIPALRWAASKGELMKFCLGSLSNDGDSISIRSVPINHVDIFLFFLSHNRMVLQDNRACFTSMDNGSADILSRYTRCDSNDLYATLLFVLLGSLISIAAQRLPEWSHALSTFYQDDTEYNNVNYSGSNSSFCTPR